MMPVVVPLGQHAALERVQRSSREGEVLFAFLDDVYTVSMPDRVCDIHRLLEESLWAESGIRVNEGKTQLWNAIGESPPGHEVAASNGSCKSCSSGVADIRGFAITSSWHQSVGTPLGHQDFVRAQFEILSAHHHTLLARIPMVEDVQSAWLLLVHCASARANCVARVVEPQMAAAFCRDVGVSVQNSPHISRARGRRGRNCYAFCFGRQLRSACRGSTPAFWASWADTLPVIVGRHPRVARQLVAELEHEPHTFPSGRRDGSSSAHFCHGI